MFLVSLKSLKGKLILLVCVVVAAVVLCVVFSSDKEITPDESMTGLVHSELNFSASTEEERMRFIGQLGFTAKESPESVGDVLIPEEFDDIYTAYNELQKECGLDLSRYKGVSVKKWTYILTDYPGYEDKDCIRINMLIYKGKIIGGDICSVELDGFMHSFAAE